MLGGNTAVRRLVVPVLRRCRHCRSFYSSPVTAVSINSQSLVGTHSVTRTLQIAFSAGGVSHYSTASTDTDTTSQQPPVTPLNDGQDNAARSLVHFRKSSDPSRQQEGQYEAYTMPHPVWSEEELHSVQITHTPPEKPVDTAAYYSVRLLRSMFDLLSGYTWGKMFDSLDEKKWLTRIIYLETVAGVPGMIGAMVRHMKSLRRMTRDHGWIHVHLAGGGRE